MRSFTELLLLGPDLVLTRRLCFGGESIGGGGGGGDSSTKTLALAAFDGVPLVPLVVF
jgi:hypothetical protein